MAALSWSRPVATTTQSKSPKILSALTHTAGDNTVVIDFYVDDSDSNYNADTIMCRLQGTLAISGQKLELTLTPYYWDGNDTYTSATDPANGTAVSSDAARKIPICVDLDAFWTVGGFARS